MIGPFLLANILAGGCGKNGIDHYSLEICGVGRGSAPMKGFIFGRSDSRGCRTHLVAGMLTVFLCFCKMYLPDSKRIFHRFIWGMISERVTNSKEKSSRTSLNMVRSSCG